MTTLNHIGHSYHAVSAVDIAMVIGGVVAAAIIAYAVVTLMKNSKESKKIS